MIHYYFQTIPPSLLSIVPCFVSLLFCFLISSSSTFAKAQTTSTPRVWPRNEAELNSVKQPSSKYDFFYHLDNFQDIQSNEEFTLSQLVFGQNNINNNNSSSYFLLISNSIFVNPVRFADALIVPQNAVIRFENSSLRFLEPLDTISSSASRFTMNPTSSLEFVNCTIDAIPGETGDDPQTLGHGILIRLSLASSNYSIKIHKCTYRWVSESYQRLGEYFLFDRNREERTEQLHARFKTVPHPAIRIDYAIRSPAQTASDNVRSYYFNEIHITENSFETNHGWMRFFQLYGLYDWSYSPKDYLVVDHNDNDDGSSPERVEGLVYRGKLINVSDNDVKVRYFDDPKKSWFFWDYRFANHELLGLNLLTWLSCDAVLFQRNNIDAREFAYFHRIAAFFSVFGIGASDSGVSPSNREHRFLNQIMNSKQVLISDNDVFIQPGFRNFHDFKQNTTIWGNFRNAYLDEPSEHFFLSGIRAFQIFQPWKVESIVVERNQFVFERCMGCHALQFVLGHHGLTHHAFYVDRIASPVGPNSGTISLQDDDIKMQDAFQGVGVKINPMTYAEFRGDIYLLRNNISIYFNLTTTPLHETSSQLVHNLTLTAHGIFTDRFNGNGYATLAWMKNYVISNNSIHISGYGLGTCAGIQFFGAESNVTLFHVASNSIFIQQHDFVRETSDDEISRLSSQTSGAFTTLPSVQGIRLANDIGDIHKTIVEQNNVTIICETVTEGGGIVVGQNLAPRYHHQNLVYHNALVINNIISIEKHGVTALIEPLFGGIVIAKYAEEADDDMNRFASFGFVTVKRNVITMDSSTKNPIIAWSAILVSLTGEVYFMNALTFENNTAWIRGLERTTSIISFSINYRVEPNIPGLSVLINPGDTYFGQVVIKNNIFTAIADRGSAMAIQISTSGYVKFDNLDISQNSVNIFSFASSKDDDEHPRDRVAFLSINSPYGHVYLNALTRIPLVNTAVGSSVYLEKLSSSKNKIYLSNSNEIVDRSFVEKVRNGDGSSSDTNKIQPPVCQYIRINSGLVIGSSFDTDGDRVAIETVIPQHPKPLIDVDPLLSSSGKSATFHHDFATGSLLKNIKVKNFESATTLHYYCSSSSSSSSSSSLYENGALFGFTLTPRLSSRWINTPTKTSIGTLIFDNLTIQMKRQQGTATCSQNTDATPSLHIISLSKVDEQLTNFSHLYLKDIKIKTDDETTSSSSILSSSSSPFPESKNQLVDLNCVQWNDDFAYFKSSYIKPLYPIFDNDRLQIEPCKNARFSESLTHSHLFSNSSELSLSRSSSPSLSTSDEQQIEEYGLNQAARNAVAVGQSAAAVSNIISANPSMFLSVSRSMSMTKLALCHINRRDLSPAQKEMKFANFSTLVLSRELKFPESLLPGLTIGDEVGAYYRGSIVGFILLFVAICLFAGFEGAVNKSKWKEFCMDNLKRRAKDKLSKSGTMEKTRSTALFFYRFKSSISFIEYSHLDRFVFKPIVIISSYWFDVGAALATGESGKLSDVFLGIIPMVVQLAVIFWFFYRVREFVEMKQEGDFSSEDTSKQNKKKKQKKTKTKNSEKIESDERSQKLPLHFIEPSDVYFPVGALGGGGTKKRAIRELFRSSIGRFAMLGYNVWSSAMKYADLNASTFRPGPGPETKFFSTFSLYQGPLKRQKTPEEIESSKNDLIMRHGDYGDLVEREEANTSNEVLEFDVRYNKFRQSHHHHHHHHEIQLDLGSSSPDSHHHRRKTKTRRSSSNYYKSSSSTQQQQHSQNKKFHLDALLATTTTPISSASSSFNHQKENILQDLENHQQQYQHQKESLKINKYTYDFSLRRRLQPIWIEISLLITLIISILSGISSVFPETCERHFIITSVLLVVNFCLFVWLRPYIVPLKTLAPVLIEACSIAGTFIFVSLVTSDTFSSTSVVERTSRTSSTLDAKLEETVQIAVGLCSFPASIIAVLIVVVAVVRILIARYTKSLAVTRTVIRQNLRNELDELEQELLPVLRSPKTYAEVKRKRAAEERNTNDTTKKKRRQSTFANNFELF